MKKNLTLLFLFLTAIIVLSSCERDEICIDPITPNFSIGFYDVDDQETLKSVNNLAIAIYDENDIEVSFDTISSNPILVPLNVYDKQTTIILTNNSTIDTLANKDYIRVSYDTEEVFVGRSCGYKTVFKNVTIDNNFKDDSDKWIKGLADKQTEILIDTTAHVKVLH